MKTRVLVLDQHCYWGGGQRVLKTVLDSLRDQIDPLVALPEIGPLGADLERDGIETWTYPLGHYRSGSKSAADMLVFGPRSVYAALRLAALISRRKMELVYINGPRCLPAGVLAAWLTGRPSLFCLHHTLSRRPEIAVVSRFAKNASRVLACSQAAAGSLLRARPALAARVSVLYYPVSELCAEAPCPAPESKFAGLTVGMVGRITRAKGHHVSLAALARLNTPARQIFVGEPAPGNRQDASYLLELRSIATRLGSDVVWAGYHPDPGLCYSVMDVLVVASTAEWKEGLPLVALEALQRGIPVVASRAGGLPEIVKDGVNGLLVPPGDPEELARALDSLARDPQLLARLGAGARASIDERFSKTAYCSAIARVIAELCTSPSPAAASVLPETEG